jgi:MFS family permease
MTSLKYSASGFRARAKRSLAILPIMVPVLLAGTASAMITTSVSLALSNPGIEPWIVQMVLTAYPIGFLIGCLMARSVVLRIGHQRSFTLFTLIAALAAAGFTLTEYMSAWFCFRLFVGLAMSALFVVCESWINLYAEQHDRGSLFSFYMLTTGFAVLLGQLLLAAAGPHSPHVFAIGAATAFLAVLAKFALGAWPALPSPPANELAAGTPQDEHFGIVRLFRLAPVTVVSIFQAGVTNLNVFVLTPLYGTGIGLSAATTVGLVTTISIAGMVAQPPMGWLSDRLDRRIILLIQGLLSICFCAAIAWVGKSSEPLLYLLFFLYGATALTIYPVAIAFANAQLHRRHMVAASGTLLMLHSIGSILTPGLASGLMARTVPEAMLFVLGTGGILVAAAAWFNLARPPLASVVARATGSDR